MPLGGVTVTGVILIRSKGLSHCVPEVDCHETCGPMVRLKKPAPASPLLIFIETDSEEAATVSVIYSINFIEPDDPRLRIPSRQLSTQKPGPPPPRK